MKNNMEAIECPTIMEFLEESLDAEGQLDFLVCAAMLLDSEKKFNYDKGFVFRGYGMTGKTVACSILRELLEDDGLRPSRLVIKEGLDGVDSHSLKSAVHGEMTHNNFNHDKHVLVITHNHNLPYWFNRPSIISRFKVLKFSTSKKLSDNWKLDSKTIKNEIDAFSDYVTNVGTVELHRRSII